MRAKDRYRDPVCSSYLHGVNVSGGRGRCCMPLIPMTRAGQVWAPPWGTVQYPSERSYEQQGHRSSGTFIATRVCIRHPIVVANWCAGLPYHPMDMYTPFPTQA